MSKPKILIICDKPETERFIQETFSRTAEFLSSFAEFMAEGADLDEDAPDLYSKYAPIFEKMLLEFLNIYPSPEHLDADILTFKSVFMKGLRNKKQKGD